MMYFLIPRALTFLEFVWLLGIYISVLMVLLGSGYVKFEREKKD
jgi:hypothetical protein